MSSAPDRISGKPWATNISRDDILSYVYVGLHVKDPLHISDLKKIGLEVA